MAERRMFAKTIIDSDVFLDMPLSTQALYFHLSMRADDDGFINNPKKIQRMVGCGDDDIKLLIAKNFLIPFESGVVVIKHWKIHNYIQKDRYKGTLYQQEKSMLIENNSHEYTLDTKCIQDVSNMDTQVRLGKDSIELDKDSIEKESNKPAKAGKGTFDNIKKMIAESSLDDEVKKEAEKWLEYKKERKDKYTEIGFRSLLTKIEKNCNEFGKDAVIDVIENSIVSGYQGIIWDKLTKGGRNGTVSKKDEDECDYNFGLVL